MFAYPLSIVGGCLAWAACFSDCYAIAFILLLGSFAHLLFARRNVLAPVLFVLAYSYADWRVENNLAHQLPLNDSNQLFWVKAQVVDHLGDASVSGRESLILSTIRVEKYDGQPLALQRIKVASYGSFAPALNQVCWFYARLKAPVGARNPGGRNRELGYLIDRISAIGYVIEHPSNDCAVDTKLGSLDGLREKLSHAIDQSNISAGAGAVLKSISLGNRSELSAKQRELFKRTGTAHLLAISGLHISLVATFVFILSRTLTLTVFGGRYVLIIYRFAVMMAIGAAGGYAALADFALPTQRAFIVVLISSIALLNAKQMLSFHTLLVAALLMLMIDPLAALSLSFWMSFTAVAMLLLMRAIRGQLGWWRAALNTHVVLSIGSLPLMLTFSDSFPLCAPLANFVAVPLMCFVIIPLTLGGIVAAMLKLPLFDLLWTVAAEFFELLWWFLELTQQYLPSPVIPVTPTSLQIVLLGMSVVVMLVPLIPHRWLFISVCVANIFFARQSNLDVGEFRLTVLDVGQGLSVLVETAEHLLVYDTGPAFGGYSAGEAIVLPALRKLGFERVDRIIISHSDNDHAGGLGALVNGTEIVAPIISSQPLQGFDTAACNAGQQWDWDGVTFNVLAPSAEAIGSKNDLSCVVKVAGRFGSALLPGDIEAHTEAWLIQQHSPLLAADILIAPHHGSSTSSTVDFVEAVAAKFVVFTAGFHNRFDFPHAEPVSRYTTRGSDTLISSEFGALIFEVRHGELSIDAQREMPLRWHR